MNAPDRNRRIGEGEAVHAGKLCVLREDRWHEIDDDQPFKGKRVIVFGLPGAFTPTCSSQHLPRYNELTP